MEEGCETLMKLERKRSARITKPVANIVSVEELADDISEINCAELLRLLVDMAGCRLGRVEPTGEVLSPAILTTPSSRLVRPAAMPSLLLPPHAPSVPS